MTIPFPRRQSTLQDVLICGASVDIDDVAAGRILEECPYDGQRLLNEDRALLLATAMEHGTFLPNTQVSFGRLYDKLYLVNGQHRMNAVALARQPQKFRVEIYECADRAALDAIYCRFDQPGGQRSLVQVSRSLGLHDENGGLRPATAALLLRAVPMLMIELKRIAPTQRPRDTRDLDAKKGFALLWKPWALDYQTCLDAGVTKHTGRYRAGGVFAVALVTLRYQNEKAKFFWGESIRNSGLKSGDPRQALHSHFLSSKRASSEYDLAEAAANAWNAFYDGRQITTCKVLKNPIRLKGTPFVGGD